MPPCIGIASCICGIHTTWLHGTLWLFAPLQAWINGVDVPGAVAPLTLVVKAGGVIWSIACGLIVGKVCWPVGQGRAGQGGGVFLGIVVAWRGLG